MLTEDVGGLMFKLLLDQIKLDDEYSRVNHLIAIGLETCVKKGKLLGELDAKKLELQGRRNYLIGVWKEGS